MNTAASQTRPRWSAAEIPDQTGRTALITGANSGLGLETTRQLARRGAHVIMAVRNQRKGEDAARRLRDEIPGARLQLRALDLADLDSVRSLAADLRSEGAVIDVLVNNAGIMGAVRSLSPQGHESQFATNHLGHFALTGLLLDTLPSGPDPRIVTVTSFTHSRGRIDFEDLSGERKYSPMRAYTQAKLANALFGLELDRRLRARGSAIRSVLAHPGYANTPMQRTGPNAVARSLTGLAGALTAQPAEVGALSLLYAATAQAAQGGDLIGPDGPRAKKGHPTALTPAPSATDQAAARRLWEVSEELTKVRFPR
ncbi:SDR family oxidoreductase [Streptomyces sp. N2-109]|uniref:SDR family oxidoreductase n=1 Tax=Streptomyces gossypii TaxID=2883101 RepID=A0ABT2JLN2_9ACTN|nr:oxidoreductase [Streptomyces gossypii]MCT2588795.1 SDR family oxidoreductase [Streptomyces gossypii]